MGGAETAQWNPKSGPEGPQKESLGAKMCFIYGANVVKKGHVGAKCQNRAKNDCHASNVLVIGGGAKAAQ